MMACESLFDTDGSIHKSVRTLQRTSLSKSLCSSVNRAYARCSEGRGFRSHLGLRIQSTVSLERGHYLLLVIGWAFCGTARL